MTRGNQRDIDRARAQARREKNAPKPKTTHGDVLKKKERDAEIMRQKQLKSQQAAAAGGSK